MATVRIEHVQDVAMVIAEGAFTGGAETEELDAALMDLMVEGGQAKVLLNLTGTTHLGSSSIGILAAAHGHAQDNSLEFWICGLNKRIEHLLDLMQLGTELIIHDDCAEALLALQEL